MKLSERLQAAADAPYDMTDIMGRAELLAEAAALARRVEGAAVSATTQALIDMLVQRDAAGRAKYGTSLDRIDLSHADWLQHMAEEMLDGAGYALAAKRVALVPVEGGA